MRSAGCFARFCGLAVVFGCDGTSPPPNGEPLSYGDEGIISTTLELVGHPAVSGGCTEVKELTTPSTPACVSGIELVNGSCSGIFFSRPVLANTQVGTASSMLDPAWITWSSTDPGAAGAEVTDQFQGTMTITEWTPTRRVFALDGQHCTYLDLATCVPASGTLVLDGEPDTPATYTSAAQGSYWQDVATGDLLCSTTWPQR